MADKIECSICGKNLKFDEVYDNIFEVAPCINCMDDSYNEGESFGYDNGQRDGYNQGYEDGEGSCKECD